MDQRRKLGPFLAAARDHDRLRSGLPADCCRSDWTNLPPRLPQLLRWTPLPPLGFLAELEQILAARKEASPESSYTARLYAKGTKRIAQKVGEEGVEVALAAMAKDREELINESADLLYHLTVLLQNEGLQLADVVQRLRERHHAA